MDKDWHKQAIDAAYAEFVHKYYDRIEDKWYSISPTMTDRTSIFINLRQIFARWLRLHYGIEVQDLGDYVRRWEYKSCRNDDDLTMFKLTYG